MNLFNFIHFVIYYYCNINTTGRATLPKVPIKFVSASSDVKHIVVAEVIDCQYYNFKLMYL